MAKIFHQCRGAVSTLVSTFGISQALYEAKPCREGTEFAKKLLEDVYSANNNEIAKASLRANLNEGLQEKASKLKRAVSKVGPTLNVAQPGDIAKFAEQYVILNGDLDAICKQFSLDKDSVSERKPESPEDFAAKLLDGAYTGETSELQKTQLRRKLKGMLATQKSTRKCTTTKESIGELRQDDIDAAAKLFDANNGDIKKLGELLGSTLYMTTQPVPMTGQEFGKNRLAGHYILYMSMDLFFIDREVLTQSWQHRRQSWMQG